MQAEEGCRPLDEGDLGLPVRDLGLHISRVKQRTQHGDGFDLEFNVRASPPPTCVHCKSTSTLKDPSAFRLQYVEKKSESDSFFGDYDSAIKPINRGKNRYSNVLPRA